MRSEWTSRNCISSQIRRERAGGAPSLRLTKHLFLKRGFYTLFLATQLIANPSAFSNANNGFMVRLLTCEHLGAKELAYFHTVLGLGGETHSKNRDRMHT